jgi:hypothetical protein
MFGRWWVRIPARRPDVLRFIAIFLCTCSLTENHTMKTYGGVEVWLHAFFDLGTRWKRMISFTPRPLYPQEKVPDTPGWAPETIRTRW